MPFVDFAAVKEQVSFARTAELLGLTLRPSGPGQWRGKCPTCEDGGDRALVVTEGKGFYCFALRKGGDQIALAAHILDLPTKEAAQEVAERAGIVPVHSTSTRKVQAHTVPESEKGKQDERSLQPLSYLEHDHELVIAIGFDAVFCKEHGIGYAGRGVAKGHVLVPFRDEHGALLGYVGLQDPVWLPSDFKSNVLPLKKRA